MSFEIGSTEWTLIEYCPEMHRNILAGDVVAVNNCLSEAKKRSKENYSPLLVVHFADPLVDIVVDYLGVCQAKINETCDFKVIYCHQSCLISDVTIRLNALMLASVLSKFSSKRDRSQIKAIIDSESPEKCKEESVESICYQIQFG